MNFANIAIPTLAFLEEFEEDGVTYLEINQYLEAVMMAGIMGIMIGTFWKTLDKAMRMKI
ncbi:hypothetical protein KKH23_06975 [Patescibacteria group bacterium]|nr:hypothetical protein [Patescibacteria group bacterium]